MDAQKLTQKSMQAIRDAQNTALEYANAELSTVHLAHALMDEEGLCYRIVNRVGRDGAGIRRSLREEVERIPHVSNVTPANLYPTAEFQRVLTAAEG